MTRSVLEVEMFGFLFAALCGAGLVATRHHHHHHGRHGGHGCGHGHGRWHGGRHGGGPRRRGGRGMRPAVMAEMLKRRLDVDEDQELVVDHAVRDVAAAMKELREELDGARQEAAATLEGEVLDEAALDALFARTDEAMARARRHAVSAVKQVHAVLDEEQRKELAQALAGWQRPGRW